MELNEETTVRGILIIINFALSGVCITLWSTIKSKDKAFIQLTKDYAASMLQVFRIKMNDEK